MTLRFRLMSRLGLVEPLVRWQRELERGPSPRTPERATQGSPRLAVRRAS